MKINKQTKMVTTVKDKINVYLAFFRRTVTKYFTMLDMVILTRKRIRGVHATCLEAESYAEA